MFPVDSFDSSTSTSEGVSIVSDMALEGAHTFTVTLPSDSTEYSIGPRNVLTVIILDSADCKY